MDTYNKINWESLNSTYWSYLFKLFVCQNQKLRIFNIYLRFSSILNWLNVSYKFMIDI